MAGESTANPPSPKTAGSRTTPVLVPQGSLMGRPDIPLDRPVTTVGSNEQSRLHLISRTVSKSHALLVNSGKSTYVADLGSRTGVIVNGAVVHESDLKTGDRVQIGKFLFRYRAPANADAAKPVVAPPPAMVIVVGASPILMTRRVSMIGRRENCEVPLPSDPAVSVSHAVIFQMEGQWFIRDLASRTGTVVNSKVIHQQAIKFGDRIQIGSSTILFQPASEVAVEDEPAVADPSFNEAEEEFSTLSTPVLSDDLDQIPLESPLAVESNITSDTPLAGEEVASAIPLEPEPIVQPVSAFEPEPESRTVPEAIEEPLDLAPKPALAAIQELEDLPLPMTHVPPVVGETPATELAQATDEETDDSGPGAMIDVLPPAAAPDLSPVIEAAAILPLHAASTLAAAVIATSPQVFAPEPPIVHVPPAKAEDFVFVPPAESVDPNALPEVIFWGDPELDSIAEQAVAAHLVAPAHEPALQLPKVDEASGEASGKAPVEAPEQLSLDEPVIEEDLLPLMPDSHDTIEEVSLGDPATAGQTAPPVEAQPFVVAEEPPLTVADEIEEIDNDFWTSTIAEESAEPSAEPTAAITDVVELTVPVETVISEEPPAPVEDFSPDGNVTVTSGAAATAGAAVVNEFIPGYTAAAAIEDSAAESPDDEIALGMDWIDDRSAEDFAPVDDLQLSEPSTEQQPVSEATPPAAPVEADGLDFLEFSEPESTPQPAAPAGAIPVETPPVPAPPSYAPRPAPSIFGFEFEGGSFIGGMPLKLNPPAPTVTAPAAAIVFDASHKATSGIGEMSAMAPAALATATTVFPTLGAATASVASATLTAIARATPVAPPAAAPATMPAAPPIDDVPPVEFVPPPQLIKRPITPPRPTKAAVNTQSPMALSGLVSDSRDAWSGPPQIPPTARQTARAVGAAAVGAGAAAAGAKGKTIEVFSQNATTIGIEVFGGRSGNPANIHVPDSKDTRDAKTNPDGAKTGSPPDAATMPMAVQGMPRRGSKIPMLVILLVLLPAAVFGLVYQFVPIQAKVVGTLDFAGVEKLPALDGRLFMLEQKKRLLGDDIRGTARGLLTTDGIAPGLTDDPISYNRAVENPASIGWNGKTLQFEYTTSDPKSGPRQVEAVLEALRLKDKDLDDARGRAVLAEEDAAAATVKVKTQADLLGEQRRAQAVLAQDRPSKTSIDQLDADATRLNQRWSDAKTIRESSASILAELRGQDPSKSIDVEADSEVVDIRRQLEPLSQQIAKLKQAAPDGGVTADAVVDISEDKPSTQPSADPLLALLQQQADQLSSKLEHRRAELKADASLTPAQRQANLQATTETMSMKVAALEKEEADDKTAADQATAAANAAHRKLDAARLADARVDDLLQQEESAKKDLQDAVANENDKQAALDACVTVVRDAKPQTSITETSDPRLAFSLLGSGVLVALLVWAIISEAGRPVVIPGTTPAAAPLVSPPQRTVPWPQPHQIEALSDNSGKAEQSDAV